MVESSVYLKPTLSIESSHPAIIKKAKHLTGECRDDIEKAVQLFYFVRDSISYNIYMTSVFIEDFKASAVLERQKGYCVQKAVLLAALLRAAGIPSRLLFASIRNHKMPSHIVEIMKGNVAPRHGYNQLFLQGQWFTAACTFDRHLCNRLGVPTVEFDGTHDAMLPETDLSGKPYIEYVEKFGHFDDLPFEWIVEALARIWGPDKHSWIDRQ
ncbi:MAG: transglutaminase family protein [Dehalococcoidia bacterium]